MTDRFGPLANGVKLGAIAIAIMHCAGCSREERRQLPAKTYRAHGVQWVYRQTEIRTRNSILAALHAGGHGYREHHVIEDETGERIRVEDRLFALQRDGRYRKVRCCEYFREQGELYNFEGRLVFQFDNASEFITDCFIHPGGITDDERARDLDSTVYGEFDHARRIFLIDQFDAASFAIRDYKVANAGRSIESDARFRYAHRKPFQCGSAPRQHQG